MTPFGDAEEIASSSSFRHFNWLLLRCLPSFLVFRGVVSFEISEVFPG